MCNKNWHSWKLKTQNDRRKHPHGFALATKNQFMWNNRIDDFLLMKFTKSIACLLKHLARYAVCTQKNAKQPILQKLYSSFQIFHYSPSLTFTPTVIPLNWLWRRYRINFKLQRYIIFYILIEALHLPLLLLVIVLDEWESELMFSLSLLKVSWFLNNFETVITLD